MAHKAHDPGDVPTHADILAACLLKVCPSLTLEQVLAGDWGPDGAPYVIEQGADHPRAPRGLPPGRRRVRIINPETGDSTSATGATVREAIMTLAKQLGVPTPEGP